MKSLKGQTSSHIQNAAKPKEMAARHMSNMNLGATRSGKISSSRAQKINIYETMTWIMVMVMMMAMPCSIEPMNYRWACEEEEIAAELATEFSFASS